ncbi:MAG: hypothetical protein MJA30_22595, partial [Cytophagales bacterium]|nr:hypothetical protein [Cytophagales bacterium]
MQPLISIVNAIGLMIRSLKAPLERLPLFWRREGLVFLLFVMASQSHGQSVSFVPYICDSPDSVGENAFIYDINNNTTYNPGEQYTFKFIELDRVFPFPFAWLNRSSTRYYEWRLDGKRVSRGEEVLITLTLPALDNGIHELELIPLLRCQSYIGRVIYISDDSQPTFIKRLNVISPCEPNVTLTYAGTDTNICSGTTQRY